MSTPYIRFTQYNGIISCRLYDEAQKKNVAKIELSQLKTFIEKLIADGEITTTKEKAGNALPVITFEKPVTPR